MCLCFLLCCCRILDACYTQCIEEEASPQGEQRTWSEDEASEGEEEDAADEDSEPEDDAAMQDAEAAAAAAAAGGRQQRKRPRSAGRGAAAGGQQTGAGGDGAGPSTAAAAAAAGAGADAGPPTKRRAQVRAEGCVCCSQPPRFVHLNAGVCSCSSVLRAAHQRGTCLSRLLLLTRISTPADIPSFRSFASLPC
jgi:hypothetical protein